MYIGGIKDRSGGAGNDQDKDFNIERYRNKFIRLSIFKGTWRVKSVYDGGYAGCNFVTAVREDPPKKYKENIPLLKLKEKDA